jgi:hypothetical protein
VVVVVVVVLVLGGEAVAGARPMAAVGERRASWSDAAAPLERRPAGVRGGRGGDDEGEE